MRVLHVITALGVGGAERMLLKLLGAAPLAAVDQQVVALLPGGTLAAPMRAAGAPVDELDFLGRIPVLTGALQLARQARRCDPDVVHGWLYHGNLGALLARAAVPRRVPLVWSIRQSLPSLAGENAYARAAIRLGRALSARPDAILFNSTVSLEQHRAFGFDLRCARQLPNGFDSAAFGPDAAARARLRSAWGVPDDAVVFAMLARHHPVKGHAVLLRAARRVLDARPAARFVLAGTGVDAADAELGAAVAGLGGRVRLLGERDDAAAILAAADVCVSASLAEASSNAIGEALSCALPCVVTRVGESPQLVGAAGWVVAPGDDAALAAALVAAVDIGPQQRAALGRQARARMVAGFGLDAVAQRYAALWTELAAGAAAAPQRRVA